MLTDFPFYLSLTFLILLLIMLSRKIRVAYPVVLVLAGLAISFIPGLPALHIESELIFVLFLPPLLFEAAWQISWKELWRWRRIIGSFAFLVVFFSAFTVALTVNYFIPGFSLALGFLLGAIVSPPDAVSAGAILKLVKVPKRVSYILEGESLLNDASSLIIFRFALIAVATGNFVWRDAALSLVWMLSGGIGIGLVIGYILMKSQKFLPTDANIDTILTILAPYIMYMVAESVHSSGVLAVVSGGLLLSNYRFVFLSSASRLRGLNVWESLSFVMNGLVFMFIGLDLPQITAGLEGVSIYTATGYGLLVTGVLIFGRILSSFAAVFVTLIARNFITVADPRHPGYKLPFLMGWSGMRGVVSLAAALSIPVYLADGSAFPQRNLILFITFVVILLTLVVQGLSLPLLIKKLDLKDTDHMESEEEIYNEIKKQVSLHALDYLNTHYNEQLSSQPVLQQIAYKWQHANQSTEGILMNEESRTVYRDLIIQQRKWLIDKNNKDGDVDEEMIRRHLLYLDLEEERMQFV
ncbi:Na+/H+ antiporter [Dyadobacter sp. CY356]|uniref:Na+/H+ antiporter n=1 Tax=Dyadobacter sp. CY356 TaxID=2906442 RepID=UPI001F3086AE|nr:Na+/H+ antiporter [Dyadobacter sp. CY356]MCF0054830.1 Na+/H+ antiporter [Dyadobacter sp. CY356]